MLPSLFKEKEEVQVLDEVTYIWEAARILGFISNWGVSVKWTEWKGPPVQITIPEDLRDNRRMKHWTIKTIKVVEEPDRAKRRNKKDPLLFNPRRLTRNTDVFFCAACETDCVDKCILMTGVVLYNDPFKRECTLRILDSEHDENPREEPEANILVVKKINFEIKGSLKIRLHLRYLFALKNIFENITRKEVQLQKKFF